LESRLFLRLGFKSVLYVKQSIYQRLVLSIVQSIHPESLAIKGI